MSPLFLDAIALTYRPDLDVLFLRWPQPVYAFTVREVYKQVLELAQETNARYWLFDIRSRGPLSDEDMDWVTKEFYPNLHAKASLTHVAYLLAPAHAEDQQTIALGQQLKAQSWFGRDADFEGFTSETDALHWLKKCQLVEVER
ncbi:hypothetical protein [Rufibacter sp. LB8]|uniref:hypothetical protein n=1 Tax=Rufibacter sp. LB8 TaxID=2777781 RepID=UPI00178C44D7|nr:hypothetical protein [Rufibacter sp. LB8]